MKKLNSYSFAIIGLGKVGTAIGHLLKSSGHKITAVSDASAFALKKALPYTGGRSFLDPKKAVAQADSILISTPDDFIRSACEAIASPELVRNKFVFHVSGAGGLDLLSAANKAGAVTASIHPLQSFSSISNAIKSIPGSFFGVTAGKRAKKQALTIVRDLGGIPLLVSDAQKPLYHAAACIASNYLVSLLNVVESLYESVGISRTKARRAYLPLIYGTLKNIEASGCVQALTGPIARGDAGTIQKHTKAIKAAHPRYAALYSTLGKLTADIAREKGTLSAAQAKIINQLLKGDSNNEHSK
jgi:predicted short-subunit dehydrogenase-like oxidoreductase (DUF2520 family)